MKYAYLKAFVLALSMSGIIFSCSKKNTAVQPVYPYVQFGEGGGFTGRYEHFKIDSTGHIYSTNPQGETIRDIGQLTPEETRKFMTKLDSMAPLKVNMNDPGNYNYYIEIPLNDTLNHRIQWNDGSPVPPDLKTHYRTMLSKIREMQGN